MNCTFSHGDRVVCSESGVVGEVTKFYVPTSSEEQTMVLTDDGRQYHAPTRTWRKFENEARDEYPIPDVTITNPDMLERHMDYVIKFAMNHGLTKEEAFHQPMVKAHAVFCAKSDPDIFI